MVEAPAIQPFGFHLRLAPDWSIDAASANLAEFLPSESDSIVGRPLTGLLSETVIHDIRNRMALLRSEEAVEHLLGVTLNDVGGRFDLSIYRVGEGFGLDAEPCQDHGFGDATGIVNGMIDRMGDGDDLARACELAARQLRGLTGFDRIQIWLNGVLVAQSSRGQGEGRPYPPPRDDFMIVDGDAAEVPLAEAHGLPEGAQPSRLHHPSAQDLDWLRTVGAGAAFVLPLNSAGRSLGQICCLHNSPHHLGVERRNIARLFARFLGLRFDIANLRSERSGA